MRCRDVGLIACGLTVLGCSRADEDALPRDAEVVVPFDASAPSCSAALPSWVAGPEDSHCLTDSERPLEQRVGSCISAPIVDAGIPGAPPRHNGRGADDDCKYQLTLSHDACRMVLSVRTASGPVEQADTRVELHDATGALLYTGSAEPLGLGRYAWTLASEPAEAVLEVFLFERCAYTDEASPRAHAAFRISP